jgi:hypothetical protein
MLAVEGGRVKDVERRVMRTGQLRGETQRP